MLAFDHKKNMPLKKYKKYTVFVLFVHLKFECEIIECEIFFSDWQH